MMIPLLAMLDHSLEEIVGNATTPVNTLVGDYLRHVAGCTVLTLALKTLAFFSPTKAAEAARWLTSECTAVMQNSMPSSASSSLSLPPPPIPFTSDVAQPVTQGHIYNINKVLHTSPFFLVDIFL